MPDCECSLLKDTSVDASSCGMFSVVFASGGGVRVEFEPLVISVLVVQEHCGKEFEEIFVYVDGWVVRERTLVTVKNCYKVYFFT